MTLFSRNWAFIDQTLQDRLNNTTLLIAGTGLGSVIAVLAARTGVANFILVDGDLVEESNLNRQAFDRRHLGVNKAEATAELIRNINPAAVTRTVPRFVRGTGFIDLASEADIVINTIDWGGHDIIDCAIAAKEKGKPLIFPMNIGWGSVVYVIPPSYRSDQPFYEYFFEKRFAPEEVRRRLILLPFQDELPGYLKTLLPAFLDPQGRDWKYDPQLGAAAALTSSIVLRIVAALEGGEEVPWLPQIISIDPAAHAARYLITAPDTSR